MKRVRIVKERSDLCDLAAAAIKATYNTRSPGEVERCIDVLNHLKSLSLSVKDIQLSESISKLETLRRHRHSKIRKEAQALFHSWLKTIYTQGRDRSFKAALTQFRLKQKKREDQRSLNLETEKIKKEAKNDLLALKQKEDDKSETYEENDVKRETKNDLKPLNLKRRRVGLEDATTKKQRGAVSLIKKTKLEGAENQKMCPVAATALPHQSRQNIKYTDHQVTTKTLVPPPRRDAARKNAPRRLVYRTEQQQTEPVKDFISPKSATLKTETEKELKNMKAEEEMVELFETAKKAADVANIKGVLSGKPEASRCVEALSLLMRINITPKPTELRKMMVRLLGLTKHKDRKICNAASALFHLWRQKIREQERKTVCHQNVSE